ncbi:hypothetical protein Ae201684_007116 [Aphanomyces euteiches]|uniref:Tetraspanin n=1 Tax=Aphanomyces euteiches TaxID=100861 RepID=A0A6G0X9I7_9STRA|nr:hypothetical protein Ae201684_007116 [Aphanomyces euteiches]KAH9151497.1 hypothetical protein AeRB84_005894 [Aphanomyces euteiches]
MVVAAVLECVRSFIPDSGTEIRIQMLGALLLGIGSGLASSYHYKMALGPVVQNVGFIFISLFYPVAAAFGYYGAKYHNKFLLAVHFAGVIALAVMQMLIATSGLVGSLPDTPYATQEACLTNSYLDNQTQLDQCRDYFLSDEFGGLRLSWRTFYEESLVDVTAGAGMQSLEDDNICCGLGPPRHCMNDTRPFPSNRPSSSWTEQQLCPSSKGGNYPTTPLCYVGGSCQFDMPIGSCGMSGAGPQGKGCAKALHQSFATTVQALCITVQIFLFLPITFACSTVCLMFKRKQEDVLPTGFQIAIRPKATKDLAKTEKYVRWWFLNDIPTLIPCDGDH